jgi:hypothetical protein
VIYNNVNLNPDSTNRAWDKLGAAFLKADDAMDYCTVGPTCERVDRCDATPFEVDLFCALPNRPDVLNWLIYELYDPTVLFKTG